MAYVDDYELFAYRYIEETEDIIDKYMASGYISTKPDSCIFMTYESLKGNIESMQKLLEDFRQINPLEQYYPFEKETFIYAAILDKPEVLDFAFFYGSFEFIKELYGIIPKCIQMGHDECLKVALHHDAPLCWWLRDREDRDDFLHYVDPFKFTWDGADIGDIYDLWGRVRCFRLLLKHIPEMQRQEEILELEDMGKFVGKYKMKKLNVWHWPKFAKHVLWRIFRMNVEHRMIVNYWIKVTGERTCALDGIGRKRHLKEFECDM